MKDVGEKMTQLIIDTREDKKILEAIRKLNIPYAHQKLEVGDYAIGSTIIERKTISDFVNSSFGHLQEQIKNAIENKEHIKHYILALIGDYEDLFWKRVKTNQSAFYGMLASVTCKYKVSVIHFKRESQFILYLQKCLEKVDGEIDFTKLKKIPTKDNTELAILCSLPNISQTKAERILKDFNVKLVLLSKNNELIEEEEMIINSLRSIDGIGENTSKNLIEYFY